MNRYAFVITVLVLWNLAQQYKIYKHAKIIDKQLDALEKSANLHEKSSRQIKSNSDSIIEVAKIVSKLL